MEANYTGAVLNDTTTLGYTDAAGAYYLGQVTSQVTTAIPATGTGAAQYSRRDYNYALYDAAVLTRTDFDIDTQTTTLPVTYSTYAIGGHGEVLSATIQDAVTVTVHLSMMQNCCGAQRDLFAPYILTFISRKDREDS